MFTVTFKLMSIGIDDRMNIDAFVYTHEY